MMKKILLGIAFLSLFTITRTEAQRFAIVDVNSILNEMDSYQQAQEQLNQLAEEWRQEISQKMDEVKSLYNKYQAEKVLLTEEMQGKSEKEIMEKEEAVRKLQRKRFGPEGDLFQKRQQLVAPIQEKVSGAIKEYANSRGYDVIFDKSSAAGILFSNDKIDKTEDIKRMLGL